MVVMLMMMMMMMMMMIVKYEAPTALIDKWTFLHHHQY